MVVVSVEPVASRPLVPIRTITPDDLRWSLAQGFADFRDMRGDVLFLALIYPLFSLAVAFCSLGGLPLELFFPMAAGLSLMGPLVAAGFYELARRHEAGLESGWSHFFDVCRSPSCGGLLGLALLMIAIFGGWVWAAGAIHDAFLGVVPPASIGDFLHQLFLTPAGWGMMLVGDGVGLAFATAALVLSWVAMPLLVDRPLDTWAAIAVSARAAAANPAMTARWGLTVAALLVAGAVPAFLGLAVVLPWLGYATWHLYTRVVDRAAMARMA